jgi:hypothetical protein
MFDVCRQFFDTERWHSPATPHHVRIQQDQLLRSLKPTFLILRLLAGANTFPNTVE